MTMICHTFTIELSKMNQDKSIIDCDSFMYWRRAHLGHMHIHFQGIGFHGDKDSDLHSEILDSQLCYH